MLNGLLITQIIGLQPGPSNSSPAGSAASDESVFRAMFGGMLGISAASSGAGCLPAGPGSAVSSVMLPNQPETGIQLSAAGQSDTVPEIISKLQAAGMQTVEVTIDLSTLGAEQLSFLAASGVSMDESNTSVRLLVAPAALESLRSMLAGESTPAAIPVAVVTGEGEMAQVIPALLTLSADDAEANQTPEMTLQFDPTLLAARNAVVKETGITAAEKVDPAGATEPETEEDTGLLREVFDLILSVLGLNIEEKTGQSRAAALRELIDKLKELNLYVATKTDPSDKESPEKSELRNLLTDLVKRLSRLQNKAGASGETGSEVDTESTDGVRLNETVQLSGNDIPDESLDVTLAAVALICGLLNQMLSGGSQSADPDGRLDFTTLATDLDDVDNQSAQGRRSVLESILSRFQNTGMTNSGSSATDSETHLSSLLDILKKLAGGTVDKTDEAASVIPDKAMAQALSMSEAGSRTSASAEENGTVEAIEPVTAVNSKSAINGMQALVPLLENLIERLQSALASGKFSDSGTSKVNNGPDGTDAPAQGRENNPLLTAAKLLLELMNAQTTQSTADDTPDSGQVQAAMPVQAAAASGAVNLETAVAATALSGNSPDRNVSRAEAQPQQSAVIPAVSVAADGTVASETESAAKNRSGVSSQTSSMPEAENAVPGNQAVKAEGQNAKQPSSAGESADPLSSNDEQAFALKSSSEKISIPVKLSVNTAPLSARASSTQHQQAIMAYVGRNAAQPFSARTQDRHGPAGETIAAAAQELGAVVESMSAGLQDTGGEGSREGQDLPRSLTATRSSGTGPSADAFRSELAAPRAGADRPAENTQAARTLHLINQAEVLEKLSSTARMTSSGGTSEIKIKLEPDNLGSMRVHLSVDENHAVSARIQVESHEARSLIENSLQRLKDSLHEQGLKVEKFNVDVRQDQGQQDQQQNASGGREGSWRGRHNATSPDRDAVPSGGVSDADESAEAQAPKNLGYNTLEWVA